MDIIQSRSPFEQERQALAKQSVVLDNQYPSHLFSSSRSRLYDILLGILSSASQLRHRATFNVVIGGIVRLSKAASKTPAAVHPYPRRWFPLSNTVTKSYASERIDKYSRTQPSRKILMLTLQFALVPLATSCPSQACDARMSMVWGQTGSIEQTG